jgi:hypothetical protein
MDVYVVCLTVKKKKHARTVKTERQVRRKEQREKKGETSEKKNPAEVMHVYLWSFLCVEQVTTSARS